MDPFPPEENRDIFAFEFRGHRRAADPIAVDRRMKHYTGGDPNALVDKTRSEEEHTAFEAMDSLLAAVRQAFKLPAFDETTGQGATEGDLLRIWNEYCLWMEKKSLMPATSPTGSEFSDNPEC